MPLTKSSRSLREWPSPKESMGRQIIISTSRIGRRQAWSACGPALERFEKEIQPEVNRVLEREVDVDLADVFIKLYMIGRHADASNPIIMICCTKHEYRDMAEKCVRDSALLDKHPGFGLGSSALPLESSVPIRRLGGHNGTMILPETNSNFSATSGDLTLPSDYEFIGNHITVSTGPSYTPTVSKGSSYAPVEHRPSVYAFTDAFATSALPDLGRCIYKGVSSGQSLHHATGGVVLEASGTHYQLTVNHIFLGYTDNSSDEILEEDLTFYQFDGESDEDDSNVDPTEAELAELEITSRGSLSPESSYSSTDEEVSTNHPPSLDRISQEIHQQPPETSRKRTRSRDTDVVEVQKHKSSLKLTGPFLTRNGSNATLDYALVQVGRGQIATLGDTVNKVSASQPLYIYRVSKIGLEEQHIIAMTASAGSLRGILLPGGISYRRHGTSTYQIIYQINLEVPPVEGDCGSAVVNEKTGDIYGHIILGDTKTGLTYIIPATTVFEDISRCLNTTITLPTTYRPWRREEFSWYDIVFNLFKRLVSRR